MMAAVSFFAKKDIANSTPEGNALKILLINILGDRRTYSEKKNASFVGENAMRDVTVKS